MSYDATNRKDIRKAEKAEAELTRTRVEFLRAALSTKQGRTWFYHFLTDCHIFSDPFSGEPYREAYLKGERNVGLRIFAEISQYCPDQYITMIKEENERLAQSLAEPDDTESGLDPDAIWDPAGNSVVGDDSRYN